MRSGSDRVSSSINKIVLNGATFKTNRDLVQIKLIQVRGQMTCKAMNDALEVVPSKATGP